MRKIPHDYFEKYLIGKEEFAKKFWDAYNKGDYVGLLVHIEANTTENESLIITELYNLYLNDAKQLGDTEAIAKFKADIDVLVQHCEIISDSFELIRVSETGTTNSKKDKKMSNDKLWKPDTLSLLFAIVSIIGCVLTLTLILSDKDWSGSTVGQAIALVQLISATYIIFTYRKTSIPEELKKLNLENEILKKQIEQVGLKKELKVLKMIEEQKEASMRA